MRTLAGDAHAETDVFATLRTEDSVTGVIQVVAALSLASHDPPLPQHILTAEDA
jgi:hypothetical protein